MARIGIEGSEWYPVWSVLSVGEAATRDREIHEVPDETVERWRRVEEEFGQVQREMREVVDPSCPECGHPGSRHQRWTSGGWGCLDHIPIEGDEFFDYKTCRCKYGAPKEEG